MRGVPAALGAALLLGGVMTAGDYIWAALDVRHTVWTGVAHGALMCLFIGGAVGVQVRRAAAGLLAGPLVGAVAAITFYALAPAVRWGAMLPAWMLFWLCFAMLQRWLAGGSTRVALARGVTAAVLSGLAFYAVSGMWTQPAPGGPNYAIHFIYWSFAFLPGFAALFVTRQSLRRAGDGH